MSQKPIDSSELKSTLSSFQPAGSSSSLLQLSEEHALLVVFLRHFGCTFCREALADLAERRAEIEAKGVKLCLVHMSSEESALKFAASYGLDDCFWLSDPERRLYESFGLKLGSLWQLFSPKVWLRGFEAGVMAGHGVGMLQGNGFQMPGAFLVRGGEIAESYVHESASDRPDYCEIASAS